MHTRRIYRWENQKETSAYLATFLILWFYGVLSAAAVSSIYTELMASVSTKRDAVLSIDWASTASPIREAIC